MTLRHGSVLVTNSPDTTRPSCHNRTRPRRSCKVPRSPRNDSLLRTVLPLQHLAHVRPAVRASNRSDTPSVNSTYRYNREYQSTNYDRHQLPTMIIQLHSSTRPTSAFNFDHPAVFYDSSDLSFRLRSSSCILRLVRPQLSTSTIQLHSTTQPTPATRAEVIGSLIYLMTCTWPNLSYIVGKLLQYFPEPQEQHWITAKHVLKYIKGMTTYQLYYRKRDDGFRVIVYSDADWLSDQCDRRSMSSYYFSLTEKDPPISRKSKKQLTVALPTCKAEYKTLEKVTQEGLYITQLLNKMDLLKE